MLYPWTYNLPQALVAKDVPMAIGARILIGVQWRAFPRRCGVEPTIRSLAARGTDMPDLKQPRVSEVNRHLTVFVFTIGQHASRPCWRTLLNMGSPGNLKVELRSWYHGTVYIHGNLLLVRAVKAFITDTIHRQLLKSFPYPQLQPWTRI